MGNKTNCLMEKIILKKSIHYINYTTILSQLNMMDIPDNIKQVKSKIRNCSENLKLKCKILEVRYVKTYLRYM